MRIKRIEHYSNVFARLSGMNAKNPSSSAQSASVSKRVPPGAAAATGPYSPVLEVAADRLVVISGQVALDAQGNIVGDTIEEQTRVTLDNCRRHLESAGCTFADVFKVNAYMADINDWNRFNVVYTEMIPEPRPARTTVGAKLLRTFLIEIEMWAVKQ
jgi:2-iminobutanoate/2-iminopropanoate deaminase